MKKLNKVLLTGVLAMATVVSAPQRAEARPGHCGPGMHHGGGFRGGHMHGGFRGGHMHGGFHGGWHHGPRGGFWPGFAGGFVGGYWMGNMMRPYPYYYGYNTVYPTTTVIQQPTVFQQPVYTQPVVQQPIYTQPVYQQQAVQQPVIQQTPAPAVEQSVRTARPELKDGETLVIDPKSGMQFITKGKVDFTQTVERQYTR